MLRVRGVEAGDCTFYLFSGAFSPCFVAQPELHDRPVQLTRPTLSYPRGTQRYYYCS